MRKLQENTLLLLVLAATAAFVWILLPYFGAILWAVVTAIVFRPVYRTLLSKLGRKRQTMAAALTVLAVLLLVIVPLVILSVYLGQQASEVFQKVQSGEIDAAQYIERIFAALPGWMTEGLRLVGIDNVANLKGTLSSHLSQASQFIATRALGIGLGALDFMVGLGVMLYLTFFLLRDGAAISAKALDAIPLRADHKATLTRRMTAMIDATVKGGVLVAVIQGALGGLAFWFLGISAPLLWAAVMAFASLVPALGAAIVWAPVALYLFATGSWGEGLALVAYGAVVIGMVDNILRPYLVGRSTRLPDFLVLISTLGGIEVLGLSGFVAGPLLAAIFVVSWEIFQQDRTPQAE